jgi:hypothetical protein
MKGRDAKGYHELLSIRWKGLVKAVKKHLDISSLILIHSEYRSDALSLCQESFIDLF